MTELEVGLKPFRERKPKLPLPISNRKIGKRKRELPKSKSEIGNPEKGNTNGERNYLIGGGK